MAILGPKTTLAAVFIGPFIVACMLGIGLVYLFQFQVKIFHVNDTIRVTGKPATVSYTTSTPVTPSATTLDGTTYTLIRPTSSYTRVYLGTLRGFDYSTFGPKTLDYVTSSKPHLNSGRPYSLKALPRHMRPTATWRFGM
uniref:Non-structural protein ns4 n=1 Tax=Murine coronavirus MHV-3 TaxID=502104 RepID=A0A898KAM2_9BETC|nr:non-structural protein ns4 [Murine coronavirus MHV-3]